MLSMSTAAVALTPAPARAQPPVSWSVAGAGCVPTGQTASGPGSFNSAGDSKFAAGRVGEIILTCPVAPVLARARVFAMTYRDPDGADRATRVRAVLRQKELLTGNVSDVAWARLDSNAFPPAASNKLVSALAPRACDGAAFVFDYARFTYYVQVNMERQAPSGDVLLASVELGNALIC
jgi:hypothetical protein